MNHKICILPEHRGVGGPASFRERIISGLSREGCQVVTDPLEAGIAAILVIGGTRRLDQLWQARRKGTRIVQRLNGINWVHRKTRTGLRHYLRSEVNNWILATIRGRLADHIVYQSAFTAEWWTGAFGKTPYPFTVIHNGVDLEEYSPSPKAALPADSIRLLVVEGRFGGGYEVGLENAVRFSQALNERERRKYSSSLRAIPENRCPRKTATWTFSTGRVLSPGRTFPYFIVLPTCFSLPISALPVPTRSSKPWLAACQSPDTIPARSWNWWEKGQVPSSHTVPTSPGFNRLIPIRWQDPLCAFSTLGNKAVKLPVSGLSRFSASMRWCENTWKCCCPFDPFTI